MRVWHYRGRATDGSPVWVAKVHGHQVYSHGVTKEEALKGLQEAWALYQEEIAETEWTDQDGRTRDG